MQLWLQPKVLIHLIQWELLILLIVLSFSCWMFYKIFLQKVNEERHKSLRKQFVVLFKQVVGLIVFFLVFSSAHVFIEDKSVGSRILSYIGLITLVLGSIVFVNSCRLFVLQYLFLTSMRAGVPLLLVNIFTLVLSLFIIAWLSATLFEIQVTPLIATSAAFSIILGLALQDTLGNLFAGISLQLDHTFEIGNWIEMYNLGQKVSGQVLEITWRSTVLVGFAEELINIPNRVVAQSHVHNWSRTDSPICRSQSFRIRYSVDIEYIKTILLNAIQGVEGIRQAPGACVIISENTESWILFKLVYCIDNFGAQHSIGDRVLSLCLKALAEKSIQPAHQIYETI
jgi:small-conductance mechanosensitive channel